MPQSKRQCETPEYYAWRNMKTRCNNPKYTFYDRYGGRGIKVCDRWLHSFPTFLADVGPQPFPHAQLDRIDAHRDYEPGNVQWLTNAENSRKRASSKLSMALARKIRRKAKAGWKAVELAPLFGVTADTIRGAGTISHALETVPPRQSGYRKCRVFPDCKDGGRTSPITLSRR